MVYCVCVWFGVYLMAVWYSMRPSLEIAFLQTTLELPDYKHCVEYMDKLAIRSDLAKGTVDMKHAMTALAMLDIAPKLGPS